MNYQIVIARLEQLEKKNKQLRNDNELLKKELKLSHDKVLNQIWMRL